MTTIQDHIKRLQQPCSLPTSVPPQPRTLTDLARLYIEPGPRKTMMPENLLALAATDDDMDKICDFWYGSGTAARARISQI